MLSAVFWVHFWLCTVLCMNCYFKCLENTVGNTKKKEKTHCMAKRQKRPRGLQQQLTATAAVGIIMNNSNSRQKDKRHKFAAPLKTEHTKYLERTTHTCMECPMAHITKIHAYCAVFSKCSARSCSTAAANDKRSARLPIWCRRGLQSHQLHV